MLDGLSSFRRNVVDCAVEKRPARVKSAASLRVRRQRDKALFDGIGKKPRGGPLTQWCSYPGGVLTQWCSYPVVFLPRWCSYQYQWGFFVPF